MDQPTENKTIISRTKTRGFHIAILVILGVAGIFAIILLGARGNLDIEEGNVGFNDNPKSDLATLSLTSEKKAYAVGDEFTVDTYLFTAEKEVVGMDANILYDPEFLQLLMMDSTKKTNFEKYLTRNEDIFQLFPEISFDTAKGELKFSALSDFDRKFNGSGTVATMKFKALKAGQTQIKFDFTEGKTTDSNVSSVKGQDALGRVSNLDLNIK